MTLCRKFILLFKACLAPRKQIFALTILTVIVFNLLEILFPKLMQLYIDAVGGNDLLFLGIRLNFLATPHGKLFIFPIILIIFALVRWVFTYMRSVLQSRLGQGAIFDLRSRIYETVQRLSFAYHDSSHSGTLISNVVEDVGHASHFFQYGFFPSVEATAFLFFAYIYMYVIVPEAAIASLLITSVCPAAVYLYFKKGNKYFSASKELFASSVQLLTENIEGQLVVNAFGCRAEQKRRYNERITKFHSAVLDEIMIGTALSQVMIGASTLAIPLTMAVSILLYRNAPDRVTGGTIFAVFFLQNAMVLRMRMLTRSLDMFMRFSITAERLSRLFEDEEYLDDSGRITPPETPAGPLTVNNVSFRYSESTLSLKNICIKIDPGETIGIVGATGAGKTTLALLISRFYDPTSGEILLDGHNIRNYPIKDVRKEFALVFQDTFLFAASVRDNIAYGVPKASRDDIVHAASLAQAHDFIMELPNGYDTVIGERGVTLSGGQRQRISLARAILKKPRFLVLDACTASIDTVTERAIQNGLAQLHSTTKIIIAQRYSSIAHADRIYVIEDGRIIETGTPEELNVPGTTFSKVLHTEPESGT